VDQGGLEVHVQGLGHCKRKRAQTFLLGYNETPPTWGYETAQNLGLGADTLSDQGRQVHKHLPFETNEQSSTTKHSF